MKKFISIFRTIGVIILSVSISSAVVFADSLNNNINDAYIGNSEITEDIDMLDGTVELKTNKLSFTPNPKFIEFLEKTNREATVTRTDKGIRILVYNYSNDPTGHPIPPLKMTVPSGWQITYSIEAIDPSPKTVGEGIISENNYFIYYVLVEKTGDTVYTENEILDWYLSMDIGSEPITTTAPVITGTTTETTVVTTQTTAVSSTLATSSVSATSTAETTPVMTTVTTPDITENVKGDANGDGKLTANDAAFIAKALAEASINSKKITAVDYPNMDFNQDGKVTAKDAADIARYLAEQSIT